MNLEKLTELVIGRLRKGLSDKLTYHNLNHTLEVYAACDEYARWYKLASEERQILLAAAILHDTGFMWTETEHEERSVDFARELLPKFGFSSEQLEAVVAVIRATKLPQNPQGLLQEIICDADLDYLGTDLFDEISNGLYYELRQSGKVKNREQWNDLQINFLKKHSYHTDFARTNREPLKQKHLNSLLAARN